jgi:hypothetical protein
MAQANKPGERRAQDQFANETSEKRFDHRVIALKYRRPKKTSHLVVRLRKAELERLFFHRYGGRLPDDDAGHADLRLMADHLAQLGDDHVRRWVEVWMPDLPDHALDELIDDVGLGRRWMPVALGKALNLDNSTRRLLDIRTFRPVDRSKAQLDEDCRKRHAERERARRVEAGATPHAMSLEQRKPWESLGISKATYNRRRKATTELAREPDSCVILLESLCGTKQPHGTQMAVESPCQMTGAPPQGGVLARAVTALSDADAVISTETRLSPRVIPAAARARGFYLTAASSM